MVKSHLLGYHPMALPILFIDSAQMPSTALPPLPPDLDLRRLVHFSAGDGRIWLSGQRMLLVHVAALSALRRELMNTLGADREHLEQRCLGPNLACELRVALARGIARAHQQAARLGRPQCVHQLPAQGAQCRHMDQQHALAR